MALKIGVKAPDFTISDQHNNGFTLSDCMGRKVLLSFHPLAWTSVCRKQMKSLEDNYHTFIEKNTTPVGISVDSVPTKHAWGKDIGLKKLRILADFWPHGQVAILYDIFRKVEGFSERANIIVSEDGIITFVKVYNLPELPDIREILDFLP
ncbi:MAG: redoxin domain-containing protein [Candidatus Cloacimonetes bacterium]|nr:redoxin domain-containing protein [Candidatus Cloacimonadota bacterium]